MATIAGARATCFADRIGTLERGKRCDAILVDLRRIEEPYLHPETDPVDAILYRGKDGDVDSVVIDGSVVLRHRELVTIDKAQVFAEIRQSLSLPPSRAELLEQQRARELQAHVEAFFSKWEAATSQPHYLVNSAR